MFNRFLSGVVPFQIMVTVGEVDVLLVENGGPLEGCSMLSLTGSTMAQLAVQRFAAAQLVLDLTAVAVGFVFDIKVFLLLMHTVRRTLLPL